MEGEWLKEGRINFWAAVSIRNWLSNAVSCGFYGLLL